MNLILEWYFLDITFHTANSYYIINGERINGGSLKNLHSYLYKMLYTVEIKQDRLCNEWQIKQPLNNRKHNSKLNGVFN